MKNFVIISILIFSSLLSAAQKKELIESNDEIIREARVELDSAMKAPEGVIYLFGQKHDIHGNYTIDITIREKGEVASVFTVGNTNGTISSQNILKDYIQNFKFNFKMPKGKRYKFEFVFKFQ